MVKNVKSLTKEHEEKMNKMIELEEQVKAKERKILDREEEILATELKVLDAINLLMQKIDTQQTQVAAVAATMTKKDH